MIKIQIESIADLRSEYVIAIKSQVLSDLKQLSNTLNHLQNAAVINLNEITRRSSANALVIKDIFKLKNFGEKPFIKKKYPASVLKIQDAPDRDSIANLGNISALVKYLIQNNKELENVLAGLGHELMVTNDRLLKKFSIALPGEIDILKLGFRYWDEPAAGKLIKDFFKKTELTKFCPYCNIQKASYLENPVNRKHVFRFDLDHFYDKDRHPVLSTSLFNLVPSCQTCNQVNKGSIQFTDIYHLNPYLSGFGKDMVFEPQMNPLNIMVDQVKLIMKQGLDSGKYNRIMGTRLHNIEGNGNVNAFQLQTKYNESEVKENAGMLLENIRSTVNNLPSLQGLLGAASYSNHQKNLQGWFEKISYTKFFQKDFGMKAYSKFNRDLLDHYCSTLSPTEDIHIRVQEILDESYRAGHGAE